MEKVCELSSIWIFIREFKVGFDKHFLQQYYNILVEASLLSGSKASCPTIKLVIIKPLKIGVSFLRGP